MLALLAALVAPYFIDWTAYRADFEREASNILGRKVIVKGDAAARLLPFPSVTFNDVEVEDDDGSSLMSVGRFRMDAELAPYLSGEIYIYSMTLDRPTVRLPLRKDHSVRWVVDDPKIPTGARVVLQNVAINDGTVIIEDEARGRTQTLLDLNATLSAGSLAGPVDGSGSFNVDGKAVDFDLSAGIPQDDGSMPLRVTASNRDLDGEIVLDGRATATGDVPQFSGSLSLVRPAPKQAETAEGASPFETLDGEEKQAAPAGPAVPPIRATGAIVLSAEKADVTDLRVEAGGGPQPYVLTGSGNLDYGDATRFSLKLEGEQVNVDALGGGETAGQPAATPEEETGDEDAEAPQQSLARRVETMRLVLSEVPRPTIDGQLQISLPVVTAGDTTIRDVAFVAEPRPAGWKLDSFAAEVPGRTRLEASGDLGVDEGFTFAGDLLVASQQPSGFSDWLTGSVDPAVRTLPRAGFSAKTTLTATRQVFDDLEVDVGGDTITGRIARQEEGGSTTMTAKLTGGRVDLDAVLALSRLFTGHDRSIADAERFDLALEAGPVTYAGATAGKVDADLGFDGDSLKVDHLDVEGLAGARLTASGNLTDLSGGDAKGKLDVELDSKEPQRFFAFLERVRPGIPLIEVLAPRAGKLAPLKLSGEVEAVEGAAGKKPTLLVRLDGTADGTKIDLSTAVENGIYAAAESGRFGLDLRLENDRPTVLLGQLGIASVDLAPPSPLEVELSVSTAETGPAVTSATMRAPGSEISLDGSVDVAPEGVTGAEFSVYVNSEDVAPWLRSLAIDLGQSFDAVPVAVNGGVVFQDGAWQIAGVNGKIAGIDVAADLDKPAGQTLGGEVKLSQLSLPWLANLAYGRPLLGPAGEVTWSRDAFTPALLPPLNAKIALEADRLDLAGGLSLSDASASLDLSPTSASLANLRARTHDAEIAGSLVMRNTDGLAGFSLAAFAEGLDLSALFPALSGGEGPARLDGAIRLDASGQSYQALIQALSGAGDITVVNARIPGVPEAVLTPLLAAADKPDFKPQAETAATFASLGADRAFDIAKATSEFTVTGGTLKLSPVEIPGGDTTLTVDASLDLADLALGGDMTLSIDPGLERVEGAEPTVNYGLSGTLAAPKLGLDTAALTNYLSVRALEREQARVEAMQESLEEKLRLRREGRFYRWREDVAAKRAEEAEARRRAAEEQAKAIEEEQARQKAAEAQAARDKAAEEEAARRDAAAAAAARRRETPPKPPTAQKPGGPPAALTFDRPVPSAGDRPDPGFQSLPGVNNPLDF
ncbi:AsmA family protein [Jiella endophytica]|uniref:AsmA family protein n=1 Tax=Jiella endophytica TaxID=2558362 RepID=A0A4Y8RL34_9HYPH|nr:AsmA family protein [Jiella endophytica]